MRPGPARELLTGWGRAAPTAATVLRPRTRLDVEELVATRAAGLAGRRIARGLGRSYGDAAQCAGGVVVDCTRLDAVLEFDREAGRLRSEAGASFDALLQLVVPQGFFLPVTPGTRFVTVGGAVASDIHGKNHHVDGSLARHVEQMTLASPIGPITCGPDCEAEVFAATCGGMGLTGVVTEATLSLIRIETSRMVVETERAADLDACLSLLDEDRDRHRYSVAWVDGLASGSRLGRAVLTRGDHAKMGDLSSPDSADPRAYHPRPRR